jgi:hypothetical protein
LVRWYTPILLSQCPGLADTSLTGGIQEEEDQRQEFMKRLQEHPDFQETLRKIIADNPPMAKKRKAEGEG